MGILKALFGAGNAAAPVHSQNPRPAPVASSEARLQPGRSLTFDPDLVDSLKDDHQALVEIFQRIGATCGARDFTECTHALRKFKSRFTDHLIVENTRFYLYVKKAMEASDPDSAGIARAFQQEMHQIAKVVTSFVDQYSISEELLESGAFAQELQRIGGALAERIDREEKTLYPLYLPMA